MSKLDNVAAEYAEQSGAIDAGYSVETEFTFKAGAGWQRDETRRHAVEVCKQMCPSKVSRGCANSLHKRETKTTRCDGDCARVKYFVNGLNKQES